MPSEMPKIEAKEKEPKISYHILYGCHVTPEDFEKFHELFQKADIYVPELEGHDARTRNLLNMLSQGKRSPEEVASRTWVKEGSFKFKTYQTIYNSKKPILFVDIPFDHELIRVSDRIDELGGESLKSFKAGEFKSALKKMQKFVIDDADYELKREAIMKQGLKEKLKRFVKECPELRDKEEIKALLTLGATHTHLYKELKKENIPASREFTKWPFVFDHISEALREVLFLKTKKPNKVLLARGMVDAFTWRYFINEKVTSDTSKAVKASRKISSKLSLKDVKKISERMGENPKENITQALDAQGIKIPKTEQEMDEMLKK